MDFLSPEGAKVLTIAGQEAAGLHHEFTGTEHLLLGLLACDDDIAAPLLAKHGIVAVEVRAQVARAGGRGDAPPANGQPLTARAKQVLALASREAEALDDGEVGPGHLLLGIIKQATGVAALVLREMGVDLEELRDEVLESRAGRSEEADGFAPGGVAELNGHDGSSAIAGGVGVAEDEGGIFGAGEPASPADERAASAVTPLCPNCRRQLLDVVAVATVSPEGAPSGRRRSVPALTLVYCGACGHTLGAR